MSVSCEFYVSSERGPCVGVIFRTEEPYGAWVLQYNREAWTRMRPWTIRGKEEVKTSCELAKFQIEGQVTSVQYHHNVKIFQHTKSRTRIRRND